MTLTFELLFPPEEDMSALKFARTSSSDFVVGLSTKVFESSYSPASWTVWRSSPGQ